MRNLRERGSGGEGTDWRLWTRSPRAIRRVRGWRSLILLFLGAATVCLWRAYPQQHPFEAGVGVVYAPGHAFILKAPEGWILDRESRGKGRLEPVFYPVGFTAKDTPMLIWAGSKRFESGRQDRIESLLAEIAQVLSPPRGEGVKAVPVEECRVGKGFQAEIYAFVSEPGGESLFARVGCISSPTAIDYVALRAKDKSFYERSLAAFAAILKSYIPFRGGEVYIPR
ncbi:hypothetical protein [Verrucomicrobium sp. 3C]|uniref:hypothetical protein n=1 Tax=Verrucomicrobium sp. 3C TaxID=1134055 RepID=UPI0003811131|nr:hypothetical protein [Verrucomicrobium sp. 3C]